MKILFLVLKLGDFQQNKWLTDELVIELASRGIKVDVVLIKFGELPTSCTRTTINENISVEAFSLRKKKTLWGMLKTLADWISTIRTIGRSYRNGKYDLIIGPSIATLFHGVISKVKKGTQNCKSIMILWDFFPVHHVQIGRIPRLLALPFYHLEKFNISRYDHVGLMSRYNKIYFDRYFRLPKVSRFILPIWGSAKTSLEIHPRKRDGVINIVFGGQLCKGRGIEQILDLAETNRNLANHCHITIIGDGPLYAYIQERVTSQRLSLLTLSGRVSREDYAKLLQQFDFGLVITTPDVDVPTFPSKSIDYMVAGLPIIACVEESTDFGSYIAEIANCGIAVTAGDNVTLSNALMNLSVNTTQDQIIRWSENSRKAYIENHQVSHIADVILMQG